jgi:hypothetical protein
MKCADGSSHLALLGQLLGDGQHGDVDAPAEQIRDDALRVGQCPLLVSVDEQLLQARVQHVDHQRAVVPTHGFQLKRQGK